MNSLTTPRSSTLLLEKLSRLVISLQQKANPSGTNQDFATLESSLGEAFKILSQFYKDLSAPIYKPENTYPDSVPTALTYNNNFTNIGYDLKTVYAELQNMQGVTLGNFNYMTSRLNRLQGKLKTVSSLLGDFILYSDLATKDALFFSDSFNNTNRIEVNSPLLNKEQCEIDQDQGIITLPIDRQAQVKITITDIPIINQNSNGVIGNNQEPGAVFHGTITDILDGNADTWFEYERVVSVDDGVALILDLTLSLSNPKVVNYIRINPNNFGTRTPVEIVSLDTSIDGHTLTSIKDDIPIAGFVAQDEANTFTLAGSTSKFAGQGLFTFTPRKIKYIHLTLRQSSSYVIPSTSKSRYAIGIRDIEVAALPYKTDGELISTNFTSIDEIRKLVLLSSQNPDPATISLLAAIDHFVSPDNGVSWFQVRPKVSAGTSNSVQTVPELIDFNGVEVGSVTTSNPVNTIRYKAVLSRNKDSFNNNTPELAQEVDSSADLFSIPASAPFNFKLQKTAIPGTIRVLDPDIGTFGDAASRKNLAIGNGKKLKIFLPLEEIPIEYKKQWDGTKWTLSKRLNLDIFVDGDRWSSGLLAGSNKSYLVQTSPAFSNSKLKVSIEFGDGTNGVVVGQGQIVSMAFRDPVQVNPSQGTGHLASIPYPTIRDTSRALLSSYGSLQTTTQILRKGETRHQLQPFIASSGSTPDATGPWRIVFSDTSVFNNAVSFIDGFNELTGSNYYSIDFLNGMLYSSTPVSNTGDTTITYSYYSFNVIDKNDWSFQDLSDGSPGISISDKSYSTFKVTGESIPSGVNYFNLSHLSVAPGTIVFSGSPAELSKEVLFVDGHQELIGVIQTSEELPPSTSWTSGGGSLINTPFNMKISSDPSFQVQFSRTDIFLVKQPTTAACTTLGDYCIEYPPTYPTGRLTVNLTGTYDDLGTVTYYYEDPQAVLANRYSVNYNTGEVYCFATTPAGVTVDYQYTRYLLLYTAARLIDSNDWEFDAVQNTVTLKDREILSNYKIPSSIQAGGIGSSKMYEIDYQYISKPRENVAELEPFFSPILRDYSLKLIPKSRLL